MTKLAPFVRNLGIPVDRPLPASEFRREQAAIVERMEDMLADEGLDYLASITELGGENDPTDEVSGQPWEWLLGRLLRADPEAAGRAARRWYSILLTAGMNSDSAIEHRPFAAYVSGVIEALLGNDLRAERWLEIGRAEADVEEAGIQPFERAYAFVRRCLSSPGSPDK